MTLEVHLMGPVRLVRAGRLVRLGGPKQQAVLAVLALSAGRRVSTDRLVDLVWDDQPPASARRTVQSYVASLRRPPGVGTALEPSQNGYTLDVERGIVDLLAFEDQAVDLLADVELGPDDRAQQLADLLSTWETPLGGLRGSTRLTELAAPFEELRLQVIERLAEAQIAGTRAGDAVKMLESLVREHPTRENLWLRLASGLNRLGRRDAALDAIQRARESLREHLGVHPSALLSSLETRLLIDDGAPSVHR
ncbi:MAG: BTAD domain-containing putative transcriptional regulator, partial [Ilumatobacter sp.]|uniref:AfsR/SARP family transcriptional regulator n=1 Tax=Ilumatobacter sp. TaxID=1967498 RepID=UPI003C73B36D